MTVKRWGRCTATNPGKHGGRDWKVKFLGYEVTQAELAFMVGFVMLAEDRYSGFYEKNRYLFFYFLDRLITKRNPVAILEVVEDCDEAKTKPPKTVAL